MLPFIDLISLTKNIINISVIEEINIDCIKLTPSKLSIWVPEESLMFPLPFPFPFPPFVKVNDTNSVGNARNTGANSINMIRMQLGYQSSKTRPFFYNMQLLFKECSTLFLTDSHVQNAPDTKRIHTHYNLHTWVAVFTDLGPDRDTLLDLIAVQMAYRYSGTVLSPSNGVSRNFKIVTCSNDYTVL